MPRSRLFAGAAECGCPLVKAALQLVELSLQLLACSCGLRPALVEFISCTAASCSFASSIFSESCAFASASCSLASSTRSASVPSLAHLLSEFAVRFLYAVGQVGQTDKRSLGQLLSQLGSLLAQTVEFLEHLGEIGVRCVRIRSHR